jgi:hypothetical protein
MNKQRLQQLIETAILLLEQLEAALDAGDNRKVGARMYELRRQLNVLRDEIETNRSISHE